MTTLAMPSFAFNDHSGETSFKVDVKDILGLPVYEFWNGNNDLWVMPVDEFHKFSRAKIKDGYCVLNAKEEHRIRNIADYVEKLRVRREEAKEAVKQANVLTLSPIDEVYTPAAPNEVHRHFGRLQDTYGPMADAPAKSPAKTAGIPVATPMQVFTGVARAVVSLTLASTQLSLPLPVPVTEATDNVVTNDERKPITPQCVAREVTEMDIFSARMDLFRETDKMPKWVEGSAQATLDLWNKQEGMDLIAAAGFVGPDHAHAQSLVTARIESVFGRELKAKGSTARGYHHFFWDTAQDVIKEFPIIKKLLKDRGLDINDHSIRNNAYASTLLYYGYSAQTRRQFGVHANEYLDTLVKRKTITAEQKPVLLDQVMKNTVNYDRHVAGAKGSARLHIRALITPHMKSSDVLSPDAVKSNKSLFGRGMTVAESLAELHHRVDYGTQVHKEGFPYQSTVVNRLNNTFELPLDCRMTRADIFGRYKGVETLGTRATIVMRPAA